jgi:3'-5' exonuclease
MMNQASLNLADVLFFDIETVPQLSTYAELSDTAREFWDHKAGFLARKEDDTPETLYQRAGIYAEFGKIVCISAGFIHQGTQGVELRLKSYYHTDEKQLLLDFAEALEQWGRANRVLCGHNIREFDLPYLCRRMLVHGIRLPAIVDIAGLKPWEVRHLDTLQYWKFGDYKHFTSLKLLAWLFNIPSPKDDIDGSEVADVYYKARDLERIVRYCERDVVTVVRLMQVFQGQPPIDDAQISLKNDG